MIVDPRIPSVPAIEVEACGSTRALVAWLFVGFVACVLLMDQLGVHSDGSAYLPRPVGENQVRLLAYARLSAPPDVLLLGSSRVAEGFDAEVIESELARALGGSHTVQRLGLDGARPWILHQCVRDLVAPRARPKLLVVGMEARLFYDMFDGARCHHGLLWLGSLRDTLELDPFELSAKERDAWIAAPFRGLCAPWTLDLRFDDDLQSCIERTLARRGEAERPSVCARPPSVPCEPSEPTRRTTQRAGSGERGWMGALDRRGLELLLDELGDLDCEVLLVRMPVRDDFDAEFQPCELEWYREQVVPEFARHGLDYVDLDVAPFTQGDEDFRNQTHLNRRAAQRLSAAIAWSHLAPRLTRP